MKSTLRIIVVAGFFTFVGGVVGLRAQQPVTPPTMSRQQVAAMFTEAQKSSLPGAEHDRLKELTGNWKLETTATFSPGSSVTFPGTGTTRTILGGRFVQLDTTCIDDAAGLKTEAVSIYGFDTRTKKYTLFGIDTMGTYSITAQGEYDAQQKAIFLYGDSEEPGMGKVPFRWTLKFVSPDEHVTTIDFKFPGQTEWGEMMRITAKRAK